LTGKQWSVVRKGPGLKPVSSAGEGIAQAEAWAYLRNKDNGKDKYGDSGYARMTSKNWQRQKTYNGNGRSRFLRCGMTNKGASE